MVSRVRRALGVRRVGHAGTLDPFATGLLIVLVGRATRLARYFAPLAKTYEVVARLGAVSSTGDPEGEIVETGVVPASLELPLGVLRQRPPAHSAVKIDGERAYVRARRGEPVATAEREVMVFESSVLWREGERAGLRFVCSSGTYVRSLVEALGDAYCVELRRTAIGPFELRRGRGRGRARRAARPSPAPGHASAPVLELEEAEAPRPPTGAPIAARGDRRRPVAARRQARGAGRSGERARRAAARRGRPARIAAAGPRALASATTRRSTADAR